ncbi:hypothetical protein H6F51_18170 [Cyanobacteria bacterium FACHB-DQ100]|nr:hypothetical protein [Cyanobacteria bacterium FACHB-DQ100]
MAARFFSLNFLSRSIDLTVSLSLWNSAVFLNLKETAIGSSAWRQLGQPGQLDGQPLTDLLLEVVQAQLLTLQEFRAVGQPGQPFAPNFQFLSIYSQLSVGGSKIIILDL